MNKKLIPYLIFGVPLLIGGFFLYKYLKTPKKGKDAPDGLDPQNDAKVETTKHSSGKSSTKSASSQYFPLKKGSRGAKVKQLQEAILIYDSKILPKFGADSDFGSETESAVKTILGKTTIDSQEDIDSIIKKADTNKKTQETANANAQSIANRTALAKTLVNQAKGKGASKDFYALNKTLITPYYITTDGREQKQPIKTLNVRDRIGIDGDTTYKIDSNGMIQAYIDKDSMKSFSPYAFELR
jgi:hypothetical protein